MVNSNIQKFMLHSSPVALGKPMTIFMLRVLTDASHIAYHIIFLWIATKMYFVRWVAM
jgi:hypothetical protein